MWYNETGFNRAKSGCVHTNMSRYVFEQISLRAWKRPQKHYEHEQWPSRYDLVSRTTFSRLTIRHTPLVFILSEQMKFTKMNSQLCEQLPNRKTDEQTNPSWAWASLISIYTHKYGWMKQTCIQGCKAFDHAAFKKLVRAQNLTPLLLIITLIRTLPLQSLRFVLHAQILRKKGNHLIYTCIILKPGFYKAHEKRLNTHTRKCKLWKKYSILFRLYLHSYLINTDKTCFPGLRRKRVPCVPVISKHTTSCVYFPNVA